MAITESGKKSDLEKRLRILRQQIYGKNSEYIIPKRSEKMTSIQISSNLPVSNALQLDIPYLYKDLFKILTFSSIALGAQLILFLLTKNQILNINFF